MSISVSIDTSKLNELLATIPGNKEKIVKAAAFHILANAQKKAPLQTGYLRANSDVSDEGGYYNVNFRADYAGYVELGTSRMYARPFLRTSVETERLNFVERFKKDLIK
jgi:HK97 gp10 family phage protein